VARTAALLVDRDFGLVGTVTGGDGQAVRVAFKGGGLKVPLDRWVKKGDVFALVQVGGEGRATRVPWTLLQADAAPGEDGACACKVLPPQQRPLTATGAGFRCLKLGTVKAPVRLRAVQAGVRGPAKPLETTVVFKVRRHGFKETGTDPPFVMVSDADGFASTEKAPEPLYDGLAFVTVETGGVVRAQVPLALVDERTITLPIRIGAEPPIFVTQRSLWERALLDEQYVLNSLFKELNEAVGKPDNLAPAIERARKAQEALNLNIKKYTGERDDLAAMKPEKGGKPLDLSRGNADLQALQTRRQELADWITRFSAILKEENADDKKQALADYERANSLAAEGEYGRAIELYEKVLAVTKNKMLEQRLPKLKAAWEPKNDAHKKARTFIYETWPKLEAPAAMLDRVKQAQDALAACKKAKDPLGPRKLQAVALAHALQLRKQLEALSPDVNPEDAKPAEQLDEVLGSLKKVIEDAKKFIEETPAP
jgi:tetratricopeptide (TPR) repeat protein